MGLYNCHCGELESVELSGSGGSVVGRGFCSSCYDTDVTHCERCTDGGEIRRVAYVKSAIPPNCWKAWGVTRAGQSEEFLRRWASVHGIGTRPASNSQPTFRQWLRPIAS